MRRRRATHRRLAAHPPATAVSGLRALALLALGGALLVTGCSFKFEEGQSLERQKRWEEAAIAYHEAVIEDPDDPEYREALEQANKVVARENLERYREFLAKKSFRKAYDRLVDAARQDADYEPVQREMAKWERVLIGGQVHFEFEAYQTNLTLADEISLIVRLNTPNPGETVDAEIDIDTGTFFAEDLLYDRPSELITFYSINSIGVQLLYRRSHTKRFTSRRYQRFINIRTPVLDQLSGVLKLAPDDSLKPVIDHRAALRGNEPPQARITPKANPHYSMRIEGQRIVVSSPKGRSDFTPRFLYINMRERRVFVDFGRYEMRSVSKTRQWTLRRLPLAGEDYFEVLSRNIALQPYFFYREGVFAYEPANSG